MYEIGAFGNIDYDKAVDGTMGPRTRQALNKAKAMGYNFDVPKQNSVSKQNSKEKNFFTDWSNLLLAKIDSLIKETNKRCAFGNCAKFSNTALRELGYIPYGNAWNLRNVDMIYFGYNAENRPQEYNKNRIISYNNEAAENFKKTFNVDSLDKNEKYIVNMYYKDSPALETAYNEGNKVIGTHTGYLSFNSDKNKWELIHETNGITHKDSISKALGSNKQYGITAIYSPRKDNLFNQLIGLIGV